MILVGLSGYKDVDRRITSFRVNGVVTDQYDAYTMATESSTRLREQIHNNGSQLNYNDHLTQRFQTLATLEFIYEAKHGNILSSEALKDVRSIETKFIKSSGYSDRCLLEFKDYRTLPAGLYPLPANLQRVQCAPPNTAMNLFYPTLNASESRHYAMYDIYDMDGNGTSIYSIPEITNFMALDPGSVWFVSRNFTVWNQTSSVLRSSFVFGAPVPPHTTLEDLEAQKENFAKWITPFSSIFATWSTSNVRLLWQGTAITDWEVTELIKRDTLFCIGSVILVLLWMTFHFRSFTLALVGMLNILASIPVGHFVTHIIMGNKFLGLLMTLPIFIILGIGCDDVFVFFDAWTASGTQGPQISNQVETRLDWTYRRAVSAMLVTSLTSSATFFIAATSPIMPIRLFGIAMGSTILANLVLVTTFFPAALLLWHRYLEHRFTWGKSLAALSEFIWGSAGDEDAIKRAQEASAPENQHNPTSIIVSMNDVQIVQDVKDGEDLPPQPLPELELDKHPYFSKRKRLQHQKTFASAITAAVAPAVASSGEDESGLDAASDDEETAESRAVRVVSKTNAGVKMILELDEEPLADPWKLNASGRYLYFNYVPFVHSLRWVVLLVTLVLLILCFVGAFYLEPQRGAQNFFPVGSNLNDFDVLTENVFNLDDSAYSEIHLVFGISGIDRSNVDLYDPKAVGSTKYDSTFNLTDPDAQTFLINVYDAAKRARVEGEGSDFLVNRRMQLHKNFMAGFRNYRVARNEPFPVEVDFWPSLKAWLLSEDGAIYSAQLGWTSEPDYNAQTLKWCTISLRSNIVPSTASNKELYRFQQSWALFMRSQSVNAPDSAKNGFATSTDFVWVLNMQALIRQAGWGTFGAILVAFVVLLLVTWNILVSLYATLSIGMVVMLVVGFMAAAGWSLGIMEFVSLTIVVGVSIGFTVHLVMAYLTYARHAMLKDKPRVAIVQYAMAEMGSPLISGAITTATSVIMLFFCKITLFSHFGKFLFVNIVASLATSFFLLVVILMFLGPRGDFGSIQAILAWNKERQRKARERKRLKERLSAQKSIDHLAENKNYAMGGFESQPTTTDHVEMKHMRSPSRHLDRSVHGLNLNESTSGYGTPIRSSVSMSDFELQLDEDGATSFDLDESISRGAAPRGRAIDLEEDDDDVPVKLTPIRSSRTLPKPNYEDSEDSDDDSSVEVPTNLRFH